MPFSLFALLLLVAVVVVVVVFAQIGFEQTDNHKLTKIYILLWGLTAWANELFVNFKPLIQNLFFH